MSRAKVMFIDADGVLHARDAHFAVENVRAATRDELLAAGLFVHCELLAAVLSPYPDLELVVHSSWRRTHDVRALRELLGPLGKRIGGVTPVDLDREASILAYMRQRRLPPANILVLDDQAEYFVSLRTRVVASDPATGIGHEPVLADLVEKLRRLAS